MPHATAGDSALLGTLRRSDAPPPVDRTSGGVLEVSDDDWLPDGALEDSEEPAGAPAVASSPSAKPEDSPEPADAPAVVANPPAQTESGSPPVPARSAGEDPSASDRSAVGPAGNCSDQAWEGPRRTADPISAAVAAASSPSQVEDAPIEPPASAVAAVPIAASTAASPLPVTDPTTAEGQRLFVASATDASPIPVPAAAMGDEIPIETAAPGASAVPVTANTPQIEEIPVELSVTDADPVPVETAAVEDDEIPVSLGEPVPGSRAGNLPGFVGIAAKPPSPPLSSGSLVGAFSIEPTVKDVDESPTRTRRFRLRPSHWGALGGAAALLAAVLIFVRSANGDGALLVTAGQSTGATPSGVRLLVDGEQRCDRLPCRVNGLTAGPHQLRAESEQRAELANIEIQIRAGSETSVPLLLLPPAAEEAKSSQAAPQVQPEDVATATDAEGDIQREARSTRGRPHARRGARSARTAAEADGRSAKDATGPAAAAASAARPEPATDGIGKLVVTSEPSGMLIVDGQQRGWTPRTLQLPAGPHSVTVQHPERGEQSSDVMIKAGGSTMLRVDL